MGTMPGPEALRRREYYGFPGNHFWKIVPQVFGEQPPVDYPAKIRLLKRRRIAVWDVIKSCERAGASDGAIRRAKPNDIPALLRKYPNIRRVFLNGQTAKRLFRMYFGSRVGVPVETLPSTSPAHAAVSLAEKLVRWRTSLCAGDGEKR